MGAGTLLRPTPLKSSPLSQPRPPPCPPTPPYHFSSNSISIPRFATPVKASSSLNSQGDYQGPKPKREWVADWVSQNDDVVRSLPIYVGGLSLLAVLVNRTISGIAPVADASRVWESLSDVTCCRSLIIVYDKRVILQTGFATALSNTRDAVAIDVDKLMKGSLYQGVLKSKSQSYLANLSLYPAKSELPFLPPKTQAVILQPLGDTGLAIIGGDMIRGFTTSDQAWITLVGEKLDATLAKMNNIPVNA